MSNSDKKKDEEINRLLKQLQQLIFNNYLMAMNLFQVKNSLSNNTPFWFSQNHASDRQMDNLITGFNKQANALFLNGIERSWKLGEENAFEQMKKIATQEQRNQGSQASMKRYTEGINLSDRIWNLSKNFKSEIETILQNGLKEGKSAAQLSAELKKYLNEPDKLFRKVRNKDTGEMELSEAAKKYKPGQGVYRSAYKNAMRLARTEIAAAYRRAAWEQYQNDPDVIGIRISLSNNHTCVNPRTGKPEPFYDICDELAGDYPKSFLWTGWHPQCRCVMTPIQVSGDEATKLSDAKAKGETYIPNRIKSVPSQFQKWMENNKDRIDKANRRGTLPNWIKDNPKFAGIKTSEMQQFIETAKEYKNKGSINIYQTVDKSLSDYQKVYDCCNYFAKRGEKTVITPKIHYKDPYYEIIYKNLINTKYERKCPDFMAGSKFYEFEGFDINKNSNPIRTFKNMISRGIIQSNHIIIDDCGISRRWAYRHLQTRIDNGVDIEEVWIFEKNKELTRLF